MTNSFESHQFCIFNENYVMVHWYMNTKHAKVALNMKIMLIAKEMLELHKSWLQHSVEQDQPNSLHSRVEQPSVVSQCLE